MRESRFFREAWTESVRRLMKGRQKAAKQHREEQLAALEFRPGVPIPVQEPSAFTTVYNNTVYAINHGVYVGDTFQHVTWYDTGGRWCGSYQPQQEPEPQVMQEFDEAVSAFT